MASAAIEINSQEDFLIHYNDFNARFARMQPEKEVIVRDPEMDVEGYVVIWNTGISKDGPLGRCGKGGTRITKDLSLEDVRRLSRAMAEKNAAAGLPLGGAKSGLKADPNAPDYEAKFKRFAELCRPLLHEHGGIFGGFGYDIGGKPPYNALWACEALGSTRSFTGKPVDMGGTDYDKEGIAGLGVAVAGKVMLTYHGVGVSAASFAVQGLGAMGAAVTRYFSEFGGNLKVLSDPKYKGAWRFHDTASPEMIAALTTQDFEAVNALLPKEATHLGEDCFEALYQDVDVVFPCAMEDAITAENAPKIQARFVCEGANNPTTEEAHEILFTRGIHAVPDIIANPGGIIAAFVELTSNVDNEENAKNRTKVEEAKRQTIEKVTASTTAFLDLVKQVAAPADKVGDFIAWRNILYGV
ncbi:MAG: Glu/Leu/Phe/Val dehydrogenase dimerization domain-containing protein [Pseudomonadota bacterium]|nr:Glu/Leu/Phe/Val dehydrogenase dimerization domain-containing protein [Pseudomonadota bacterium]